MFISKGPQYSEIEYVNVNFSGKPKPLRTTNDCNATTAVEGLWWERQKET